MLNIKAHSVQGIINVSAKALAQQPIINGYKGTIATLCLQAINNSFNLGCSTNALAWGATSNHAINATAITAIQFGGIGTTKGVHTKTNTASLSQVQSKWQPTLNKAIQATVQGNVYMANAMVYPLVYNTKANNKYKLCALYMQYQYNNKTKKLSLIVNYRAQHIYMLACNLQYHALQLLTNCITNNLKVGSLTLICNHHHIVGNQSLSTVTATSKQIKPWLANTTSINALIKGNNKFYNVK